MSTSNAPGEASHPRRIGRYFIGGEWLDAGDGPVLQVINPATEDVYLTVAEAGRDLVDRAVAAARTAFDEGPWPRMDARERAAYLDAIADGVAEHAGELGRAWTCQTGALASTAAAFSGHLAGVVREFARLAEDFAFVEQRPTNSGAALGLKAFEPVGVVAAIIPWNAPLMLMVMKIAPALAAGCTVIVKSAPETPEEAEILARIVERAKLPPGVINFVTADRDVSEHLVRHPGVDKVSFTGSTAVGRRIGAICSDRVARLTLELGGKSPAIVLDDYPPEQVAEGLAPAVSMMAGQTCAALTRLVVSRRREKAVLDALQARFEALKVGDPADPATELGPLSLRRQRDRVEHFIAAGKAEGARLVTGGRRPPHMDRGFFIEPTIFSDVATRSPLAREEIFGPVLSVIVADGEEDLARIANDSAYGLNATVFTNDPDRAYALARRLRSGTVAQNGYLTDFSIGFGGFKQSGLGREGGEEGLLSYLESKTILLQGAPNQGVRS